MKVESLTKEKYVFITLHMKYWKFAFLCDKLTKF